MSGVIHLAADSGISTTAVGVDSYEQSVWLHELGCRFGIGHFYGTPTDWLVLPTPHRCDQW